MRAVTIMIQLGMLEVGLCAQATWIVDANNGPGTSFTDLPPAVAAAQPYDVVVVRSGDYTGTTVTRGISIVAQPGALFTLNGGLVVRDVPQGESVAIKDMAQGLAMTGALILDTNAGTVHIGRFCTSRGILIRDCARVTLTDCCGEWVDIARSEVPIAG